MTIVACHQPNFIPWLGYFAKIARCESFVLLDDVQFTRGNNKHNWTTRVRILGANGPAWLSMPVRRSGEGVQKISDLRTDFDNRRWLLKLKRALEQSYCNTPHFNKVAPPILDVLSRHTGSICVTNIELIETIAQMLNLPARRIKSSTIPVRTVSTDRLVDLVRKESGSVYLSGDGAAEYEEIEKFEDAGIELRKLGFQHPVYPQRRGSDFVPGLSIFDALCFVGVEQTVSYVRTA